MGSHAGGSFRVLPAVPAYVLRSPDATDTPFPEVLSRYSDAGESQGWLLHPNTELQIENAYYREGAPKHGVDNFVGTEKAFYQVRPKSLHLISVQSGLTERPADQPRVQQLIRPSQLHYSYYRYSSRSCSGRRQACGEPFCWGPIPAASWTGWRCD
jgi:hypothetical protein